MPIKNSHIPERSWGSAGAGALVLDAGGCWAGICADDNDGNAEIAVSAMMHGHVINCFRTLKFLSGSAFIGREKISRILSFRPKRGIALLFVNLKLRRDSSLHSELQNNLLFSRSIQSANSLLVNSDWHILYRSRVQPGSVVLLLQPQFF